MQQQLNADSVVLNHVKSRNSTWLKLAIDDQHRNTTVHNVITGTRQIETDYRLLTDYHKPIIDYVKQSYIPSLESCGKSVPDSQSEYENECLANLVRILGQFL